MKLKHHILVLFTILSYSSFSTPQVPDYLTFQGKKLKIATGWGHPSPLETYFYQNKQYKYPFQMLRDGNKITSRT